MRKIKEAFLAIRIEQLLNKNEILELYLNKIYLPADAQVPYHRIVFAHGFYASALHEISHWCIAGKARRELV
ncbi:elongation factor P hydroxylase, partial [Salmonella enterica subsp. enterica serovar Anatum]|nr:elongation factor P hydroxylase [Salmonella enterica subsp. enterica serovar Anatum]